MILSRRKVENLIAQGHLIFIVDQRVIKADAWLPYHPGGDMAIRHMVGRDATDEVTALHSTEAKQRIKSYQIGQIEGVWENFLPPIHGGQFRLSGQADEDSVIWSYNALTKSMVPTVNGDTTSELNKRPPAGTPPSSATKDNPSLFLDAITQKELDIDIAKYPAIDQATQQQITDRYRVLHEQIKAEDLFRCNYWNYAIEIARYTLLFSLSMSALRSGWYATSGIFLGLFWHQLVFSAHDAGHMGITHNFQIDTCIGIVIADFLGGLSMGWWKRSHNVHHIVTNSVEHDPDIQLLPFFACSHRFLSSLFSTYHNRILSFNRLSSIAVPYQHYSYYIILLFGRFNLYVQSWIFLFGDLSPRKGSARYHRTLELIGQAFFWFWFGYLVVYRSIPTNFDRVVFVLLSHMVTAPLHVQIIMSHYAMSTADFGVQESFAQRMLRTTMDVHCPQWLDFIHGGLQFQAIHHLFPRVPRHNLRRTQKLVQGFCEEVGIPYALMGFVEGNKSVVGRLREVGVHASALARCQQALVAAEDYGVYVG